MHFITHEQRDELRELCHTLFKLRNPTAPQCVLVQGQYAYVLDHVRRHSTGFPAKVSLPYVIPQWDNDARALLNLILEQSISMRISNCKDATYVTARSQRYDTRKRVDVALQVADSLQYTYACAALRCCIEYQQRMGLPATNKDVDQS